MRRELTYTQTYSEPPIRETVVDVVTDELNNVNLTLLGHRKCHSWQTHNRIP